MYFLKEISDCVVNMDDEGVILAIDRALDNGLDANEIYSQGLSNGMLRVTRMYENKEYYVPEVIVCADTLKKGINYLKSKGANKAADGAKVIIAVVEGDHHEIGKNIVKIMMEAANFQVIDMGLDVGAGDIVQKAIDEEVDVIGLSTMMTTTMPAMKDIVEIINGTDFGNKEKPKVIVGGGCLSHKYAKEIGCDGYSKNAIEAVKLVNTLLEGGYRGSLER